MDEFEIIRRYFNDLTPVREDVALGIGDDAALLRVPADQELVVTTDTLVSGRHFPADTAPDDIGWKSLAVNLSDLAAMGAQARWVTLALTLPEADAAWLKGFAHGLGELAKLYGVTLVGGDTTRGPLSITITAMGGVPAGTALTRSGAKPGDMVCITGTLGDAAIALKLLQARTAGAEKGSDSGKPFFWRKASPSREAQELAASLTREPSEQEFRSLRTRLERPMPRLKAGAVLRPVAHAAIDLSDGLAGDLSHILDASGVGADIWVDRLPASPILSQLVALAHRPPLQLLGGDDYELCVCLPPEAVMEVRRQLDIPLTIIGHITDTMRLRFLDARGATVAMDAHGYRHFT